MLVIDFKKEYNLKRIEPVENRPFISLRSFFFFGHLFLMAATKKEFFFGK
jgi:hypothetical protein